MATTSIGDNSGALITAQLIQQLTRDLANDIGAAQPSTGRSGHGVHRGALPAVPLSVSDLARVLLSEVATSDLSKLIQILGPAPDANDTTILQALLVQAVQEVTNGNAERAVGYLADYATRSPRSAESLPLEPALEPVRDKIDSMVNRMTVVAKMSAEDGLSRAEQTVVESAGKVLNWDTRSDVLLKVAKRLFDAGGYANYSRTIDLARVVSETSETKPAGHALAASASASAMSGIQPNQLLPGVNVPYWASPDVTVIRATENERISAARRSLGSPLDDVLRNLHDLKEISRSALAQLWMRAPLLVLMIAWFTAGLVGGVMFATASHIWPRSAIVSFGDLAFNLWGIGFLALVGFGFYVRVRYRP